MALRGSEISRALTLTVSTTKCLTIRRRPYRAKMEFVYDYLIEYGSANDTRLDLIGIENAIAYGVASALNTCDQDGSPLYAVELTSRDQVSQDGKSS